MEERLLVDFLRVVGMADEDQVHFAVLAGEEEVEQREEALGEVLLVLVHRRRDVHQAEHRGARDRLGSPDAIAIAQVELVEKRQPLRRRAEALELVVQIRAARSRLSGRDAPPRTPPRSPASSRVDAAAERDAARERLRQRADDGEVARARRPS